jgi:D-3-phosphoglycerate dehydrogenase
VAGAALDVFAQEPYTGPLLELDNVVVTPHLGASTREAQDRAGVIVAEQVAATLEGRVASNAVNVPAAPPEELEFLGPFFPLATKLGELAFELAGAGVTRLELTYLGELAEHDTRLLTVAVLGGAFRGHVEEPVNFVNAPLVARERGIEVSERSSRATRDYTSLMQVTAHAGSERAEVAGTTFGSEHRPRLVGALGYEIEVELEPFLLFIENEDKPGRIGRVGTALGEAGVNIATMAVSRNRPGGNALMVLTVDTPVPPEVLDRLRAEPGLVQARFIRLGS